MQIEDRTKVTLLGEFPKETRQGGVDTMLPMFTKAVRRLNKIKSPLGEKLVLKLVTDGDSITVEIGGLLPVFSTDDLDVNKLPYTAKDAEVLIMDHLQAVLGIMKSSFNL